MRACAARTARGRLYRRHPCRHATQAQREVGLARFGAARGIGVVSTAVSAEIGEMTG